MRQLFGGNWKIDKYLLFKKERKNLKYKKILTQIIEEILRSITRFSPFKEISMMEKSNSYFCTNYW